MLPALTSSILAALAASSFASPLLPRNDSSTVPSSPGIITTITDSTGADITSSFQTLLYQVPYPVTSPNLTDRQVQGVTRAINSCRHPLYEFKNSRCTHHPGVIGSMQRFTVTCIRRTRTPNYLQSRVVLEHGSCQANEICVNGAVDVHKQPTMASCIGKSLFEPRLPKVPGLRDEDPVKAFYQHLAASTVLSKADGSTPLKVETLEVDAGVVGDGQAGEVAGTQSQATCQNCVEVATEKFGEGTDFLRAEATLGAAGAITAGILWLAVLSG